MLINANMEDIDTLYRMYTNNKYPIYFRHFSDMLNKEQFLFELAQCGNLTVIEENGIKCGILMAKFLLKPRICEVSVCLYEDNQHKGIAFKAMKDIASYSFNKGIKRLVCIVSREDKRTCELLEKGGFIPEARLRQSCYYNKGYKDEIRFSLPKEKYLSIYRKEGI